ncbi:hypothetical protein DESPIG_01026 [Desulfovibrio piger ATCC 29098]|uniref:Uncharacterized protein n=1 Tax=Desulfovibrio piger ATCC 29098 TaxID=411464 RepID=B6WSN6_9BACT|nr:hypothetical protein DESPIG_01026 [Desulfovibrio piger ATCC 29098]
MRQSVPKPDRNPLRHNRTGSFQYRTSRKAGVEVIFHTEQKSPERGFFVLTAR